MLKKGQTQRIDDFLEVLPNANLPFVNEARDALIDDVRGLLSEYLNGYRINIRLRRYKGEKDD
jgi:hypothetical protein